MAIHSSNADSDFERLKKCNRYSVYREESARLKAQPRPGLYEKFMPTIYSVVLGRTEKDPVIMFENTMKDLRGMWDVTEKMPANGPWHHAIIPGILIATLRNNGYRFDDEDVKEALFRGHMVPAGACGFLGTCGCAVGVGVTVSIVTASTPLHDKERSKTLASAAEAIRRVAVGGGGPKGHCCTKSAYIAITYAVNVLDELGYKVPSPTPREMVGRCKVSPLNKRCHRERCMYFPAYLK
jgi:hypothetical protein